MFDVYTNKSNTYGLIVPVNAVLPVTTNRAKWIKRRTVAKLANDAQNDVAKFGFHVYMTTGAMRGSTIAYREKIIEASKSIQL